MDESIAWGEQGKALAIQDVRLLPPLHPPTMRDFVTFEEHRDLQTREMRMGLGPAELIAYASRSSWVRAGDVLASGTCASGALAEAWGRTGRQEPPLLKPGDVVTMTIEGIGTIENEIVPGAPEASPILPARSRRGSDSARP